LDVLFLLQPDHYHSWFWTVSFFASLSKSRRLEYYTPLSLSLTLQRRPHPDQKPVSLAPIPSSFLTPLQICYCWCIEWKRSKLFSVEEVLTDWGSSALILHEIDAELSSNGVSKGVMAYSLESFFASSGSHQRFVLSLLTFLLSHTMQLEF
jgi:hypothetical protein